MIFGRRYCLVFWFLLKFTNMKNQKLVKYIQSSLAKGKSKEEIYKELLNKGEGVDVIQDAFNQIAAKTRKEDTQKRAIRIILTIGAILIGVGIFSFIAANWREMPKVVKISIIVISMTSFYIAGLFFREKMNYEKTGEALFLLGAIIYGAGIFLIAQMFNIRGNWADGFILWMIGVIVMAFAVESLPLFYLSIFLGIFAIIGHAFVGYDPFLLTSSCLLFVAAIVTFLAGWVVKKRTPPELKEFY